MSHEKIAAKFDEWATTGKGESMEQGHGDVTEQVIEQLNIRAGYQVLDLGCGIGWATRILAKTTAGVQAIGIDASPAMIKKAEELHSYTIRARYELSNFESLDFNDGKFDQVFSVEAIYYAPDLGKALTEACRVTKGGGNIDLLVDFYKERPDVDKWPEYMGLDLNHLSEGEWVTALEQAGFSNAKAARVIDRRDPGKPEDFQDSGAFSSWENYLAYRDAGSLWVHAEKA